MRWPNVPKKLHERRRGTATESRFAICIPIMVFTKVPCRSPKVTEPPTVTYKFEEVARVLTNELPLSLHRRRVHPRDPPQSAIPGSRSTTAPSQRFPCTAGFFFQASVFRLCHVLRRNRGKSEIRARRLHYRVRRNSWYRRELRIAPNTH